VGFFDVGRFLPKQGSGKSVKSSTLNKEDSGRNGHIRLCLPRGYGEKMAEILFENEAALIKAIRESEDAYGDFRKNRLKNKINRESQVWDLLVANKGKYSKDLLNQLFDMVDFYEPNKRWFGNLLATPNRNLIFESSIENINAWIEKLLFSDLHIKERLNACLTQIKIKGASKGLATLLLYLSNPENYNIWVNKTQDGLSILNRIGQLAGKNWGENYVKFNEAALDFRTRYGFAPQEIDWLLTFVASYVSPSDSNFLIDEDVLKTKEIQVPVDDEDDIDDVVGEPMELQVMRWTPTNEMGVVALFIEFRKALGFPIVEVIRTRFPDAAVFQESTKGYIRRYIEFEFRSSGYKSHIKSKRKCHYVVCWEHDWKECPVDVIELRQEIPKILGKK
jgi:hypothetical protein